MSTAENKAKILAFYDLAASGEVEKAFQTLLGSLDAEVVVHESPLVPWGGDYEGVEAFVGVLPMIAAHVDPSGWEVLEVIAEGDSVSARCSLPYRPAADGAFVRTMICEWFRFRDGRIIELWPLFFDVPQG